MKIHAPIYYNDFRCIADKCTHCCCIGWRIGLTDEACNKYKAARGCYADELRLNISTDEDGAYIPLDDRGRCPHLDDNGLCRVITVYGEEYLTDICKEHPRFYNDLGTHLEVGLGASCIEAARIILSSPISNEWNEVGDADLTPSAPLFPATEYRDRIYGMMDHARSYNSLEDEVASTFGIPKELLSGEYIRNVYREAEYIDEANKSSIISPCGDAHIDDTYLTRMLWYFLCRHLGTADSEPDARARITFSLLSARAVENIYAACSSIEEAFRIYSEEIEYSTDNTDAIIFDITEALI